jgi:DNA-binding beta-propeller fold protein YncE
VPVRHRSIAFVAVLTLLATACSTGGANPTTSSATVTTSTESVNFAGLDPAPEFPTELDWINVDQPLTLESLKGKIVLLDFWSYGCLTCIRAFADIDRLQEEFPDELVVIGVHAGKFTNERETQNIAAAVDRIRFPYPVINDSDYAIWSAWGIQEWASLVLIDPAGNIVGGQTGENLYDVTQPVVAGLAAQFADSIDRTPRFETTPLPDRNPDTLSYPGKVTVSGIDLFIADSGNNRVLRVNKVSGEVLAAYGNGSPGFLNGVGPDARFDGPQGLVVSEDGATLYVADANNHAVRSIDLATGEVSTLAGTGEKALTPAIGLLDEVSLSSPWDLTLQDGVIYVAMAGLNQIWILDTDQNVALPAVGSSQEGGINGPLASAQLAQPSSLMFTPDGLLFFADTQSSSIRWADTGNDAGRTGTVAGAANDLLDYGDTDGVGAEAHFQHPAALVWDPVNDQLIIADSYNSKLKTVNIDTFLTTTWLGDLPGFADGDAATFWEPGGLAVDGEKLYVADTNNNAIRVVDIPSGQTTTLILIGLENFPVVT